MKLFYIMSLTIRSTSSFVIFTLDSSFSLCCLAAASWLSLSLIAFIAYNENKKRLVNTITVGTSNYNSIIHIGFIQEDTEYIWHMDYGQLT